MTTETTPAPLKRGGRVRPSGKGRTATWNGTYTGTVTAVRHVGTVSYFVRWDGIAFIDERTPEELELIP